MFAPCATRFKNTVENQVFCFVHPIFRFCFLVTWKQSHEKMKILRDLCLHFARQNGQDGKTGKKIMQLK